MFVYKYGQLFEDIDGRRDYIDDMCLKKVDPTQNIVALNHKIGEQIIIDQHFHDWLEFSLVIDGQQEITVGDNHYQVSAGDFYMIDYNVLHGSQTNKNQEVQKLTLQLKRSYLQQLAPMLNTDKIFCRTMQASSEEEELYSNIKEIYITMMETFYKEDDLSSFGFEGYLRLFLYTLIRDFSISDDDTPISGVGYRQIESILTFLHHHYQEEITLEILAKEFYLTPKYISKIFQKELHTNFKDYLAKIRLNHALYEMEKTDKSLSDIAYDSGFSSQKSFIAYFRKMYGKTPKQYRLTNHN